MTATSTRTFSQVVTSIEQLRGIVDPPKPDALSVLKERTDLDQHCRAFITQSPFLLLATSGASGRCDVSPRGDAPGFVHVLDERTIVIPDRPGNRHLDSLRNIIENPHAGVVFMVPNVDETLRINGRACIIEDTDILGGMVMQGRVPRLGVVIEAEEVFFHCARAFKRARLWQPDTWIEREALPSLGQILADQINPPGLDATDLDRSADESNRNLY